MCRPNCREPLRPGNPSLNLDSYGGGTDQTPHGPGIYGFNFWYNRRLPDGKLVWPGMPEDMYQANGMWNRDTVTVIPSWRMVVAVRGASHDHFAPGSVSSKFNRTLRLLTPTSGEEASTPRDPKAPKDDGSPG